MPHPADSSRARTGIRRLASCALVALFAVSSAAQSAAGSKGGAAVPTLASINQALLQVDYTVEQLRRFRSAGGGIVTVREQLQVDANGTTKPQFALDFLAVEGEPAGSPLSLKWQQTYARYGTLFFRNGSFQVRDLLRAKANYTLHDFGPVARAGRAARRMVVFPNAVDKALWVLDVDIATHVPLFVAEFDNSLKIFAEIEVVTFARGVQGMTPSTPLQAVVPQPDFAAASTFLGDPPGLIDPDIAAVMGDYGLENIDVHQDPINGREKLVMSYTDGVDQFLVIQTVNVADPFAGLPGTAANTIGRFRDPAVSALVFWDNGVSFHVAGRGSLTRLDDAARSIYRQALSN